MEELSKKDVYIFFGPDFVGKNTFYKRELTDSHVCVQPSCIYQKNPTYGFRDVCFQIVSLLKEGWKVAIVDKNECKKTRMSYVKLLQKKCGAISFGAVSLLPQYGCDQLFWTRELRLAEESIQSSQGNQTSNIPVCDSQLQKWFMGESNVEVSYQTGIVEALSENEGFEIVKKIVGICTRSEYKFEVPALFLQWEFFSTHSSSHVLLKICQLWSDKHTTGRIIIICDGYHILTGETRKSQELNSIDEAVKVFVNKFTSCPMYVFHACEPKLAGSYIVPPKPGILAFLQQRHCLNLHSKRTLYVYETTNHMKMAETAGVGHIKGSRLIEQPKLVLSYQAASTPVIPEMLQTMRILSQTSDGDGPSIQLYDTSSQHSVQQQLPHGRSEYLYYHDRHVLEQYNKLYKELATKVGEPGSKISPKKVVCVSSPSRGSGSREVVKVTGKSSVELSHSARDLPKWMKKRDHKKAPPSLEKSASSDSSLGTHIRKTVYVMTDKELLEVACEVLKQGGKTAIVDHFLNIENEKSENESKPVNHEQRTTLHSSLTTHRSKTLKRNKVQTLAKGNKKANICPKIEPDSDSSESEESEDAVESVNSTHNSVNSALSSVNSTHSFVNSTHSSVNSAQSSVSGLSEESNDVSVDEQIVDSKVMLEDSNHVEDIVADVLDEFSTSSVTPKQSPRKRASMGNKSTNSFHRSLHPHTTHLSRSDDIQQGSKFVSMDSNHDKNQHTGKTLSRDHHKKPRLHHHLDNSPDMSHLEDIF